MLDPFGALGCFFLSTWGKRVHRSWGEGHLHGRVVKGGITDCIPSAPLKDHKVGSEVCTLHQVMQSCLFFQGHLHIVWQSYLGVPIC